MLKLQYKPEKNEYEITICEDEVALLDKINSKDPSVMEDILRRLKDDTNFYRYLEENEGAFEGNFDIKNTYAILTLTPRISVNKTLDRLLDYLSAMTSEYSNENVADIGNFDVNDEGFHLFTFKSMDELLKFTSAAKVTNLGYDVYKYNDNYIIPVPYHSQGYSLNDRFCLMAMEYADYKLDENELTVFHYMEHGKRVCSTSDLYNL